MKKTKRTHEEFLSELAEVNADIEVLENYVRLMEPILCRCRVCGKEWKAYPGNLLRGHGCPVCARRKSSASRTKSHDQFIGEMKSINPNIEILEKYQGAFEPIECRCNTCGHTWKVSPTNLLSGRGCPECAKETRGERIKKTHKDFLQAIEEKKIQVEALEEYIDSRTPITCRCKVCGKIWEIRPNNLLRGYGCPDCGLKMRAASRTKEQTTLEEELKVVNPDIEVLESYKGARIPILCKCRTCGYEWKAAPTNLLKDRGCPQCAIVVRADKLRRTHEEFLAILQQQGRTIEPLEEYRYNNEPIKMLCKVCGYVWSTKPGTILAGHGCPKCTNHVVYTQEEFVGKLFEINPHIEVISEYQRSAKPIDCKCLLCGHVWTTRPNGLLRGAGCPACFHSTTSFVEQCILLAFCFALGEVNVQSRVRSIIGQELDIYIPSLKLAIEPGSWRWHSDKVEKDWKKRVLCREKGIRLITIYTDFFEKEPPFTDDCICVAETLGFEKEHPVMKALVEVLFKLAGVQVHIPDDEWDNIKKRAYAKSRRMTTAEFKERIARLNANIEVLGEYTGAWNRIECRCNECGTVWKPRAQSLSAGHGCPQCAHTAAGKLRKRNLVAKKE